jgi:hypothetical protein
VQIVKKLILFFVSIVLLPVAFAQTEYQQKTFVFSIPEESEIPGDSEMECEEGLAFIASWYGIHDINPNLTLKRKIYSVKSWDKTGKVINNEVNQIGEILACLDFQTYVPYGRNLIPIYYEITISGRKFRIAGAGTSPESRFDVMPGGGEFITDPAWPEKGLTFLNHTGRVLPAIDGKPGGSFNIMNLSNPGGVSTEYDHGTMGVLIVLIPLKP